VVYHTDRPTLPRHLSHAPLVGITMKAICCSFFLWSLLVFLLQNVAGLAAKKNNKGGRKAAASNRGFGAGPAEVFEEVCSKFKTRLPSDTSSVLCPCGTGEMYETCCAPYHRGTVLPDSPTKVLRTRYTAFTYRIVPYILDTTHETCRDYRENRITWAKDMNKNGMFDSFQFVALEPGPEIFGKDDKEVFIDFKVRMQAVKDFGDCVTGQEMVIGEKSRFICDDSGKWTYASGDVSSLIEGLEDMILNH